MKCTIACLLLLFIMCFPSCKKDTTDSCSPTDTTQTYTAKIKPIMDANCVASGCHDAASAPLSDAVNLSTFDGTMDAVKNKNMINQLQSGTMPKNAPALPDSLINRIISWRDNCYQQ